MEINEKKKRSKSKKPYSSRTYTTGDPQYNMDKFNEIAGTGSVNHVKNFGSDGSYMNGTISPGSSSSSDGVSSGGEGGGMGEALVKEETHNKYAMPEGDRIKAFNNALKYAKKYNAPFCYGYDDKRFGLKFFAFEQPFKWNFDDAGFRKKYKATGNIYVAYPDQRPRKESFEGNNNMKNLTEQKIFVSKAKEYIDIPDWINLVPVQDVSKFISNLAPEQVFKVGYVTPIYFYKKLLDKFTLVKLTEMMGYTGVDYRDAAINDKSADEVKDRLDRAANQISNPTGETDYGIIYNKENDRVKSHVSGMRKDYADTNKVVAQGDKTIYEVDPKTGRKVLDANKQPIVKEVVKDLKTILFYPTKRSLPKINYYIDLKDGNGFFKVDRNVLVDTIYKKVFDIINRDTHNGTISSVEDMTEIEQIFLTDIMGKAQAVIDNDAKTASGVALSQGDKVEKNALSATISVKPDVRALYTGQIYMLDDGKSEFLGQPLVEGLKLKEAKRYVRRYYIKPQNIFCSNKAEILKALIDIDNSSHQNCTIYTLNNLGDIKDVNKLQNSDIIYYYDGGVLYDKNKVKVMDYDLYIKHEENRDEINPNQVSDKTFNDVYDDRMTDNTVVEEILIDKGSLEEAADTDSDLQVMKDIHNNVKKLFKNSDIVVDRLRKGVTGLYSIECAIPWDELSHQEVEDLIIKLKDTFEDYANKNLKDYKIKFFNTKDKYIFIQFLNRENHPSLWKNKKNEALKEDYYSAEQVQAGIEDSITSAQKDYNNGKEGIFDAYKKQIPRLKAEVAKGGSYAEVNKVKLDRMQAYADEFKRLKKAKETEQKADDKIAEQQAVAAEISNAVSSDDALLNWLEDHTTEIYFSIPDIQDQATPVNVRIRLEKTAKNLENQFPGILSDPEHFEWEHRQQETNKSYYGFWGISGHTSFDTEYKNFPDEVKALIGTCKLKSIEAGRNKVKLSIDQDESSFDNIYLAFAILDLFNNDLNFYKKYPEEPEVVSTELPESLQLKEGYPYMTTNGYKIYNASEYAVNHPYIIARWVENGGDVELWFYGAYDSLDRAQAAKDELSNGVLIYAKDSKFFNESIDNEFELDFDDVNAYGEKLREGQEVDGDCCICGEPISGYGNNAEPYAHGRCCDACNLHFVIPARIAQMNNEK